MADIKGITIQIGGDTTKLVDSLKKVETQIKGTQKDLRELDKLLKLNPGNTELIAQKQKALSDSINATTEKLKKQRTALEQLRNAPQTDTTIKQQQALTREIEWSEQKLRSLKNEYLQFGTIAGQQLQVVGNKIRDFGTSLTGVGRSFAPVSAAVTGLGTVALMKFAEVDKIMTLTNATMKNTEEQAKMLDIAMQEAAKNSIFSMADAAQATLNFARAGLDAGEAAAALAPAMNLAAGEGGNLDTVSAGLVATINTFHDSFDRTAHYADVFAAACNNSALDVNGLSGAMSTAGAIFSALGKDVEDAALYLGILANRGVEANEGANSLKTGFARLAAPTKEASNVIKALGIEIFESNGKMKDSVEVHRILHDSFSRLSEQEKIAAASVMFGKNQMGNWLKIIDTAPTEVDKLSYSIKNNTDITNQMSEAMMTGTGGAIEKIKSSFDVLITTFGRTVAEGVMPLIDKIQDLINWFQTLDDTTKNNAVQWGLLIAAVSPVLIIVGQLITAVGTIVKAFGILYSAMAVKLIPGFVALLAPFAPLIAKIGLVVAATWLIVDAIKGVGAFADWLADVWTAACDLINSAIKKVYDFFKSVWDWLWGTTETVTEKTNEQIQNVKKEAITAASETSQQVISVNQNTKSSLQQINSEIQSNTKTGWTGIKNSVVESNTGIVDNVGISWGTVEKNVLSTNKAISNDTQKTWNNLQETAIDKSTEIKDTVVSNVTETQKKSELQWIKAKDGTYDILTNMADSVSTNYDKAKESAVQATTDIAHSQGKQWGQVTQQTTQAVNQYSQAINQIGSDMSSAASKANQAWHSIEDVTRQALYALTIEVRTGFTNIANIMRSTVNGLRNIFDFEWHLPHLKLPHFRLVGRFDLEAGTVPTISVDWYKKAMDEAYILNSATIFGASNGKLLGGGEAGSEVVVGTRKLMNMIKSAISSVFSSTNVVDVTYDDDIFFEAIERIGKTLDKVVTAAVASWNSFKDTIIEIVDSLKKSFTDTLNSFSQIVMTSLSDFDTAYGQIKEKVLSYCTLFEGKVDTITQKIITNLSALEAQGLEIGSGITGQINNIQSSFVELGNQEQSITSSLTAQANTISKSVTQTSASTTQAASAINSASLSISKAATRLITTGQSTSQNNKSLDVSSTEADFEKVVGLLNQKLESLINSGATREELNAVSKLSNDAAKILEAKTQWDDMVSSMQLEAQQTGRQLTDEEHKQITQTKSDIENAILMLKVGVVDVLGDKAYEVMSALQSQPVLTGSLQQMVFMSKTVADAVNQAATQMGVKYDVNRDVVLGNVKNGEHAKQIFEELQQVAKEVAAKEAYKSITEEYKAISTEIKNKSFSSADNVTSFARWEELIQEVKTALTDSEAKYNAVLKDLANYKEREQFVGSSWHSREYTQKVDAAEAEMSTIQQLLDYVIQGQQSGQTVEQKITIPVYIGNERIDELVARVTSNQNYRSGGR